ncbi:DEAD/DEAH box helicase family protein [Mycoplasma zalophidermidis]|uniref:type I site-specific deoxyribonuclease n=1 Tax=Mycoplasma zalophidermidis TaxID=398174 RepID=A0ABS6DSP1_9MOLU|nr:DEAD/DEAH box helicase family protein [Mycoplasma zalophidermidis]MBU4693922.1 DEAD/DEAH box helicase family protein [Mycoplasma zalophidermidis]
MSNFNYDTEKEFQKDLTEHLTKYGNWKVFGTNTSDSIPCRMNNVDEDQIWNNWRKILNQMNKDKLGEYPITDEEFKELKRKVDIYTKTVSKANESLREGLISINRTDERSEDYQKDVYLRFFPHGKVNPADNIYQVATEVNIERKNEKRLDVVLLINGVPLYHIELKRSASRFSKARDQIKTYFRNGIYQGLFGFVQVLVAMTPNKMSYWPNATKFNMFEKNIENRMSWTNFDNLPIDDWETICNQFLSIPAAHKLIQDYSIANNEDDELLLLRSYQFHAVESIMQKFDKSSAEDIWKTGDGSQAIKGGYVWHTTGSGKTLTSFKTARLLLDYNYANKVIFVVDRVALNNQTQNEFNRFENRKSEQESCVLVPKNSKELGDKLLKTDISKQIIVTTINKLSEVVSDKKDKVRFSKLADEKFVFIFDEAHRSVSGQRYAEIINFFKNSVVIGFTGTPIFSSNSKNNLTTRDIFGGNEPIHTYTIANGIKDGKVLKFSIDYITLDKPLIYTKWLEQSGYSAVTKESIEYFSKNNLDIIKTFDAETNPKFSSEWRTIKMMIDDKSKDNDEYIEIEKKLKDKKAFSNAFYQNSVAKFIIEDWYNRSSRRNFSGLFATSSIEDAINYFELFHKIIDNDTTGKYKDLKITAIFDDSIASDDGYVNESKKILGVDSIIDRYNTDFNTNFSPFQYSSEFKNDVLLRLAHKGQYNSLNKERGVNPEKDSEKLDIVIVVSQLLTGYDSKYINTVYYDKEQSMESLIQSISRTNRILNDPSYEKKLFGNIVFIKSPCQMYKNIREAFLAYAHADKFELVEVKTSEELIEEQLNLFNKINHTLNEISTINNDGYIVFNMYEDETEKFIFKHKFSSFISDLTKLINNDKAMSIKNTMSTLAPEWDDKIEKIKKISNFIPILRNAVRDIDITEILEINSDSTEKDVEEQIFIELEEVSYVGKNDFIGPEWIAKFNSLVREGSGDGSHKIWDEINTMVTNNFPRKDLPIINEVLDEYKNDATILDLDLPYDRILFRKQKSEENKVISLAQNYNVDVEAVKMLYLRKEEPSAMCGVELLFKDYEISSSTKEYLEKNNKTKHIGRWIKRQVINSFTNELTALRENKKSSD